MVQILLMMTTMTMMTVVVCSASCHVLIAASPPHLSTPALAVAVAAAARSLNYEKRQSRVYAMALQDAAVVYSTEALRDAVLASSPWLFKMLHILCNMG